MLALALALAASACGGGGDSATATTAAVTKAEFIKRADLICRKADAMQPREQDAFWAREGKRVRQLNPRQQQVEVLVAVTLPSVAGEIRQLESLQRPQDKIEKEEVDAILTGWKTTLRQAERKPYPASRWDLPAVDTFTPINKMAVRYGFNDCRDLR